MSDTTRPLVTFALFAFNQEQYVRQAVHSAFAQTYSPLEIILSDDGSTDATAEIIREMAAAYSGPHLVSVNVNSKNTGIAEHVNKVFGLAHGEYIVLAAGDDISYPKRTAVIVDRWLSVGERKVSAIFSCVDAITADGNPAGRLDSPIRNSLRDTVSLVSRIHPSHMLVLGASSAYSPAVLRKYGALSSDLVAEDIPLAVRASFSDGIEYIDEPLVAYRTNVSSWLPAGQADDTFDAHYRRHVRRARANLSVITQVLEDVLKNGTEPSIDAVRRQYALFSYLARVCDEKKFLPLAYFRAAITSHRWLLLLTRGLMYAFPRLHRTLFAAKGYIFRLRAA